MDWLLTVPALDRYPLGDEAQRCGIQQKAWTRGLGSALMMVSAYYGELAVTADLITQVGAAYGRGRGLFCTCKHEGHHSVPLFRSLAVQAKYQSGAIVSGLVTFVTSFHYLRIFNFRVDAHDYSTGSPKLTSVPSTMPTDTWTGS